jgi:hypothetical protein
MTAPHLFKLRKYCLTVICHGAMVGHIHEKSRIRIRIRYSAARTVPKCLGSTLIVTTMSNQDPDPNPHRSVLVGFLDPDPLRYRCRVGSGSTTLYEII